MKISEFKQGQRLIIQCNPWKLEELSEFTVLEVSEKAVHLMINGFKKWHLEDETKYWRIFEILPPKQEITNDELKDKYKSYWRRLKIRIIEELYLYAKPGTCGDEKTVKIQTDMLNQLLNIMHEIEGCKGNETN